MNPDQLPETRAARRFRRFFEHQGKREALLTVLTARGLSPSAEEGEAIAAYSDAVTLDQWLVRATTAASVAEVLRSRG